MSSTLQTHLQTINLRKGNPLPFVTHSSRRHSSNLQYGYACTKKNKLMLSRGYEIRGRMYCIKRKMTSGLQLYKQRQRDNARQPQSLTRIFISEGRGRYADAEHTKRACDWMRAALCWKASCWFTSAWRRRSWSRRTFSSFRRAPDSRSPTRVHWRPSSRAAKNSSTAAFSERSSSRRTAPAPIPLPVPVPLPLGGGDGDGAAGGAEAEAEEAVFVLAGVGALSPAPGVSALGTLAS